MSIFQIQDSLKENIDKNIGIAIKRKYFVGYRKIQDIKQYQKELTTHVQLLQDQLQQLEKNYEETTTKIDNDPQLKGKFDDEIEDLLLPK